MAVYTVQDYLISIAILFTILWFISRYLFRLIHLDDKFLLMLSPYVLFGVSFRMMVDVGVFEANSYWTVTPGVYIIAVVFGSICTLIGVSIEKYKGLDYWYFPFFTGLIAAGFFSFKLIQHIIYPSRLIYPVILAVSITVIIYASSTFFEATRIFRSKENLAIIFAHLLDGSATFIGINVFHFSEEHLLPDYLISMAGNNAIIMIPLKIIVILSALYIIEKWYGDEIKLVKDVKKTEEYYWMFKILFFVLGFGPGLRDTVLPAVV